MNAFAVADMLDAAPDEKKRRELAKQYLEQVDFPEEAKLADELVGYHFYGMLDGMVVFRVDGTWMIRGHDAMVKELKEWINNPARH